MVLGNTKLFERYALKLYKKIVAFSELKAHNDHFLLGVTLEDILSYAAILFQETNVKYYAVYVNGKFYCHSKKVEIPEYLPYDMEKLVYHAITAIYFATLEATDEEHKRYPDIDGLGKNARRLNEQECMQYLLFYTRLIYIGGDQKFFTDWRNGIVLAVIKRFMKLHYLGDDNGETKSNHDILSCYKGCLLGGAVGDALGYPVEFMSEAAIFGRYGEEGIKTLKEAGSPALISDDTQMTLFAGNACIYRRSNIFTYGINPATWSGKSEYTIWNGYQEWLGTQGDTRWVDRNGSKMWIYEDERLHSLRAPGNTCLNSIRQSEKGGTLENPVNNSKGCGTVMRAGVIGLTMRYDGYDYLIDAVRLGRRDAALTHGHALGVESSGWLAATVANIINLGYLYDRLEDAFVSGIMINDDAYSFPSPEHLELIDMAITLAYDLNVSDLEAIHMLGEGWVAEEALAIAVFCAVRYQDDFAKAIRVSVNHKGDSDSTGAICGNLLGAWLGKENVAEAFDLNDLELSDVIETIAEDLYTATQKVVPKPGENKAWDRKYRR